MVGPRRVPALGVAYVLVLAACEEGPGELESQIVRDSVGITLVDNPEDVWAGPETWRLSPEPVLRIGAVDGEEPYLFGQIADIIVLSDGRIVVAEGADRTLRWFDDEGRFLFQRGGLGQGPGEISSFGGVTLAADDTIVVRDRGGGRVVSFGPDGSHLGTTTSDELRAPSLGKTYRLSDGSYLIAQPGAGPDRTSPSLEPGLIRIPVALLRVPAGDEGGTADTIGVFPGPEREVHRREGVPAVDTPYFQRTLSHTVTQDRIYVGTQEPFEINVFSAGGEWLRSIRARNVDIELGEERLGAFRDWMLGRLDGLPPDRRAALAREFEETLAQRHLPENVPAYSTFLPDRAGNLWVAEYRFELNLHPPDRWVVFDPEGRFVSTVTLPPDFTLLAVTEDRVYGRWTDEMDVQYVAAYAFEKP